jgi:hypothetical protein
MSVKTFTGSNIRRNIVGCAENCRVVVVRLGKIKCAANWVGLWVALQPFLFCEGIAKRLCRNLHCRSVYVCRLMVALSGLRVADNLLIHATFTPFYTFSKEIGAIITHTYNSKYTQKNPNQREFILYSHVIEPIF